MVSSIGNEDWLVGSFLRKEGKICVSEGGGGGGGEGVGGWVVEERGIINPFYPPTQPGQMTQTSVQVFSHALTYLSVKTTLENDS